MNVLELSNGQTAIICSFKDMIDLIRESFSGELADKLETKTQELESDNSYYEDLIETLESENDAFKVSISELEQENRSLKREINGLKEELEEAENNDVR